MKILALDLSIAASGFAIFKDGTLIEYGVIKPEKYKNHSVDRNPVKPTLFAMSIAEQINSLVSLYDPDHIVIEEVSSGGVPGVKSIKSLCGLHFVVMSRIVDYIRKISFLPPSHWRKALNIRLSSEDKEYNKTCMKKKDKIGWKDLSKRYVNKEFNLNIDDDDISDSIAIGYAYIKLNT